MPFCLPKKLTRKQPQMFIRRSTPGKSGAPITRLLACATPATCATGAASAPTVPRTRPLRSASRAASHPAATMSQKAVRSTIPSAARLTSATSAAKATGSSTVPARVAPSTFRRVRASLTAPTVPLRMPPPLGFVNTPAPPGTLTAAVKPASPSPPSSSAANGPSHLALGSRACHQSGPSTPRLSLVRTEPSDAPVLLPPNLRVPPVLAVWIPAAAVSVGARARRRLCALRPPTAPPAPLLQPRPQCHRLPTGGPSYLPRTVLSASAAADADATAAAAAPAAAAPTLRLACPRWGHQRHHCLILTLAGRRRPAPPFRAFPPSCPAVSCLLYHYRVRQFPAYTLPLYTPRHFLPATTFGSSPRGLLHPSVPRPPLEYRRCPGLGNQAPPPSPS